MVTRTWPGVGEPYQEWMVKGDSTLGIKRKVITPSFIGLWLVRFEPFSPQIGQDFWWNGQRSSSSTFASFPPLARQQHWPFFPTHPLSPHRDGYISPCHCHHRSSPLPPHPATASHKRSSPGAIMFIHLLLTLEEFGPYNQPPRVIAAIRCRCHNHW
jgi:hypothetical protein